MPIRNSSGILVPVLVLLAACGGDGGGASAFSVRDSAGVAIADNTAPAWGEGEGWRVVPEPVLDIGGAEGEPAYQLDRVGSVLRLGDGRIVVANAGSREIRFYDARGRHLRSAGREGGGPGEFKGMSWLGRLAGDTLGVWDHASSRLSLFSPAGDFLRAAPVRVPDAMFALVEGAFGDGTLLMTSAGTANFREGTHTGRDTVPYLRYTTAGALRDTVGRFAYDQTFSMTGDEGGGFAMRLPVPFGPRTHVETRGDRVYVGDSEHARVAVLDTAGTLRRLIRWPAEARKVTPEEIEEYKRSSLEQVDASFRQMQERVLAKVPFPETKPAYQGLAVDAEGNLWLKGFAAPGEETAAWTVLDAEGRLLGTVRLPARLGVSEIGRDYILGILRDDLDVEHVVMYRLEK